MPSAVGAHVRISVWDPAVEGRLATCLRRWRTLPLAEMVPFHSTQASGSKLPRKVLWTQNRNCSRRYKWIKKEDLARVFQKKGSTRQPVTESWPPNPLPVVKFWVYLPGPNDTHSRIAVLFTVQMVRLNRLGDPRSRQTGVGFHGGGVRFAVFGWVL
jgi:hypothetical protein